MKNSKKYSYFIAYSYRVIFMHEQDVHTNPKAADFKFHMKGGGNMAVVSTAVNARARITYMENNAPDFNVSGVNPLAGALQLTSFIQAVQGIQDATINDAFLIVETDLEEA